MTADLSTISNEEAVALVQGSPLVHFAGFVTIEDKNHMRVRPVPNVLQHRIAEAYEWCIANGIPPRIMCLKPRQKGSSTFCGHICYHHSRRFHVDGMIIGDEADRTMKVWQIFTEYSQNDIFPWDSAFRFNTQKATFTYRDGTKGEWEHDTANDPKAGISGTRQVLWFTEAARYAKSGARTDSKVITAALNSLAKVPHSLAFAESTADGASGWFYENWSGAATLDQVRTGEYGNGWIKVFAAWFEFEDARLDRLPHTDRYFDEELSAREKRGVALYGWTMEQIAWRRSQIENECANDESVFDQDYPEDEVQCFLSSGRPRFSLEGVARLEMMAKAEHNKCTVGLLEVLGSGTRFTENRDEGWLWVAEPPKDGRAYIAFIDPCTGEQSAGAKNPDAHAAGILRAPFVDQQGTSYPAELVAAIHVPPTGCRWDDALIAERLVHLANWYGGCMIVPETGNGLGVLVKLREFGATVYQREKFDRMIPGKKLMVAGWETNKQTRPLWVGAIADAIREQERAFDCRYLPATKEMRTFVVDDRGRAEAKTGMHDDWVAGIGIGLYCINFASIYRANLPPVNVIPFGHSAGWSGTNGVSKAFS